MKIDTDDLCTSKQIAKRANVTPAAVSNWRTRVNTFPKPVFDEGRVVLYLWWQVEAWLKHTGKMT